MGGVMDHFFDSVAEIIEQARAYVECTANLTMCVTYFENWFVSSWTSLIRNNEIYENVFKELNNLFFIIVSFISLFHIEKNSS